MTFSMQPRASGKGRQAHGAQPRSSIRVALLSALAGAGLLILANCSAVSAPIDPQSTAPAVSGASAGLDRNAGAIAFTQASAVDSNMKPEANQPTPAKPAQKIVGVVLFPGFEVLDVFGPVEMWAYVPDFQVVFVSEHGGAVKSAQSVSAVAEYSFANSPQLDIMMVPGGVGTYTELNNPAMLDFIRKQNAGTDLTTSVCTGSALLAKAGVLKGRKATSNKNFFSLAVEQDSTVDWQGAARWVEDGKFITSSGVSAGMDMALGLVAKLYGRERAVALARGVEYVWSEDAANDPFAIQHQAGLSQ